MCAGFHVVIAGQKFFAFANYSINAGGNVTSNCGYTNVGFFHNSPGGPGVLPTNWGCYYGELFDAERSTAHHTVATPLVVPEGLVYTDDVRFAAAINREQSGWVATAAHPFTGELVAKSMKKLGKRMYQSMDVVKPTVAVKDADATRAAQSVPDAWDWRNVSNVNYVCPVRNQGQCGSCYSFGSTGSLCSRTAIISQDTSLSFWSPQTVVSCSPYTEGCDGGFSYNVFKYGEDFGIPWDTCFPVSDDCVIALEDANDAISPPVRLVPKRELSV